MPRKLHDCIHRSFPDDVCIFYDHRSDFAAFDLGRLAAGCVVEGKANLAKGTLAVGGKLVLRATVVTL